MLNRLRKSIHESLGPWQTNDDSDSSSDMVAFCDKTLPPLNKKTKPLTKKINDQFVNYSSSNGQIVKQKPRPKSFVNVFNDVSHNNNKNIFERLTEGQGHRQVKEARSAQKTSRPQKQQMIGMRNFIMEGQTKKNKENMSRRKQSAFIMKQKFAEIRRSMNIPAFGLLPARQNAYYEKKQSKDKQAIMLRLTRYDLR